MKRRCAHCGRPEDEHHAFQAQKLPDGCVCGDDGTWNIENIRPACKNFIDDGHGVCEACEHDKACHKTTG